MTYNLFLDDYRDPPKGRDWIVASDYNAFCEIIQRLGVPQFISFDHDLADVHYGHLEGVIPYNDFTEKTGYHCAMWLIEYCRENGCDIPPCNVHSMNPVGAQNIRTALDLAMREPKEQSHEG